ncbi:DNA topology modulation protein [Clostridium sp. UBA5119]|uniref:DNA topology modulation protein n=1 Tax=Clostridium sp. UBA5119 TaxID=1946366 RepID=UPI00321683FF
MKKIAVIGSGGSGKSTFSRKLGNILNLPVHHLDTLYWNPGWIETPKDKWESVVRELADNDQWIIEGNYRSTMDIRLNSADTIIFLNMSTLLCTYRIIKRRFMFKGKKRPDMTEGCEEKLDLEFVKWVLKFNKNERPKVLEKLKNYENKKKIIVLENPRKVDELLRNLKES